MTLCRNCSNACIQPWESRWSLVRPTITGEDEFIHLMLHMLCSFFLFHAFDKQTSFFGSTCVKIISSNYNVFIADCCCRKGNKP